MQRQSEMVLQQLESSAEVEASVATHGPIVARKLDEVYAQNLEEGQRVPDFQGIMFALKDRLAGSRQDLAVADGQNVEQLRQLDELQQESLELFPKLYRHMSAARHTMDELFGKGSAFRIASIEGPTAQRREKLLRQTELAIARFEQPNLEFPASEFEGFTVEPEGAARGLKTKVTRLRTVSDEQRRLNREAQESRKVKNRMLEEHKQTFLWTARTLEGFYRLAGEDELADRIRPSLRRRGRREVDVEAEAAKAKTAEEETGTESVESESVESDAVESDAVESDAVEESTDSTS